MTEQDKTEVDRESIIDRVLKYFQVYRLRLAVVSAAAIAVIFSLLPFLRQAGVTPMLSLTKVEVLQRSLFTPVSTRAGLQQGDEYKPFDAREAAVIAFTKRIEFHEGEFKILPDETGKPIQGPASLSTISIVDSLGHGLAELEFQIRKDALNPIVWVLSLPDRELMSASLGASNMKLWWEYGSTGCITISYEHNGEHETTAAHLFDAQ
jgi:hypothetical protein